MGKLELEVNLPRTFSVILLYFVVTKFIILLLN